MPAVVGLIALGLLLGPTVLSLVSPGSLSPDALCEHMRENVSGEDNGKILTEILPQQVQFELIRFFALVGVSILLFMAGLETDPATMLRAGRSSLAIASGGVALPFLSGCLLSLLFSPGNMPRALLTGTILTATSVSVSAMSLMGMKKIQSREGTAILTAAIIDDLLGIIILSVVLATISGDRSQMMTTATYMVAYLGMAVAAGMFLVPFLMNVTRRLSGPMSANAVALGLMFLFAGCAEVSHVAGITGAYLAGLFVGRTQLRDTVRRGMETIGHSLFVPFFFIFIGLQIDLKQGPYNWGFISLFLLVAVLGKILGSGLMARASGFRARSAFTIGAGMIPRGEVTLVIASVALHHSGVLDASTFAATVMLVIVSSFITPLLMSWGFAERGKTHA